MGLGPSFCKHCLVDMKFVDDLTSTKTKFGYSGTWLCPKCGSKDSIALFCMGEEMVKKMDEQNNSSWWNIIKPPKANHPDSSPSIQHNTVHLD